MKQFRKACIEENNSDLLSSLENLRKGNFQSDSHLLIYIYREREREYILLHSTGAKNEAQLRDLVSRILFHSSIVPLTLSKPFKQE